MEEEIKYGELGSVDLFAQPTTTPLRDRTSEDIERDKTDVFSADTLEAGLNVFKNSNYIYDITQQVGDFKVDEQWKPNYSFAVQELKNSKLATSTDNIKEFMSSVSEDSSRYILERLKKKQNELASANKILSEGSQTAYAVAGSIATPDVVLTGGLALAGKLNTVRKALAVSGSIEALAVSAKMATDVTYSEGDALGDMLLMTTGETLGGLFMAKRTPTQTPIQEANENVELVSKKFRLQAPVKDTDEVIIPEYKPKETEAKDLDINSSKESFMEEIKQMQRDSQIERDRLKKEALDDAEYKRLLAEEEARVAKIEEDIRIREEAEYKRIEEEYRIREQHEAELEDVIRRFETDPKYDKSVMGSILRNTKKLRKQLDIAKKKSAINSRKIETIKQGIKGIENKLAELNQKIKAGHTNKGVVTKWKKKVDELRSTLKQEKDKLQSPLRFKEEKKLSDESRRLDRIINSSFDDINQATKELKVAYKNMNETEKLKFKNEIDELVSIRPELKELQNYIEGLIANKNKPMYNKKKLKLTRKQQAIIFGVAGTSYAQADDGNGLDTGMVILALAVAGVITVASVGGIGNILNKVSQTVRQSVTRAEHITSPAMSKLAHQRETLTNMLRTRLTETITPIAKESKKGFEIAKKLLHDSEGTGHSAEIRKRFHMHRAIAKFFDTKSIAIKEFSKEKGISFKQSLSQSGLLNQEFSKSVRLYLETGMSDSKAVKMMGDMMRKEFENFVKLSKEAGVYGSDKMKLVDNYFPRLWDKANIQSKLTDNPDNRDILKKALVNAFNKGSLEDKEKLADKLINGWLTNAHKGDSHYDDIFGDLEDLLKEGVTREDVTKATATYSDIESRLMARIDMDLSKLDNIKFKDVNGDEILYSSSDFVKTDITEVFESFANSMSGSIALAEVGYDSRTAVMKAINDIEIPTNIQDELTDVVKHLYNEPLISNGTTKEMISVLRDITLVTSLPLVATSMILEVFKTVVNGGIIRSTKNLAKVLNLKKGGLAADIITDNIPIGTSMRRQSTNIKQLGEDNPSEMGKSLLAKYANVSRDVLIRNVSQMARISDIIHKTNLLTNIEKFAGFIHGTEKLPELRLKSYGITEDSLKLFSKDDFVYVNNQLQTPDFKNWSKEKKDAFENIQFRMMQETSPEATTGGTPLWFKSDPVGQAFSPLLSYTTNVFGTQGLRDLKYADGVSALNLVTSFAGAYVGLQARYALLNKEPDEDMLLLYAALSIPQAGAIGTITGLMSPATVQLTQDVKDLAYGR